MKTYDGTGLFFFSFVSFLVYGHFFFFSLDYYLHVAPFSMYRLYFAHHNNNNNSDNKN